MNTELKNNNKIGSAMVVGGGIGGMQAALDLAESGIKVYLVDNKPCIGGVMAQLDKTFPTNDCAMCTMAPRLVEVGRHKDIEIITLADIENITGKPGNFTVTLNKKPRYIDEEKCTGCGLCVENCPVRNIPYVEEEEKSEDEIPSEDKEKVDRIIDEHKPIMESLLPILLDVNVEYRYLPKNIIKYVSKKLNIPFSQVYSISAFYNAFSLLPRGEYTISVCMGTACYVKGGQKILEAFERELDIKVGGTTDDMKFSLETVNCLGCCGQSPVVTVNEDIYGYLKQTEVPKIIKKYK